MISICDDASKNLHNVSFDKELDPILNELEYRQSLALCYNTRLFTIDKLVSKEVCLSYNFIDDFNNEHNLFLCGCGYFSKKFHGYSFYVLDGVKYELKNNRGVNILVISLTNGSIVDFYSIDTFVKDAPVSRNITPTRNFQLLGMNIGEVIQIYTSILHNDIHERYEKICNSLARSNSVDFYNTIEEIEPLNSAAYAILGFCRRYGYGCTIDIEKSIKFNYAAYEYDRGYVAQYIDSLLCSEKFADWQMAYDLCLKNTSEWTDRVRLTMELNDVVSGNFDNINNELMKNSTFTKSFVKFAYLINSNLFDNKFLILYGSKHEINYLLTLCMQYSVIVDYIYCTDSEDPVHSLLPHISKWDDVSLESAIISIHDLFDYPSFLNIFCISPTLLNSKPLLVPNPELGSDNVCIICEDYFVSKIENSFKNYQIYTSYDVFSNNINYSGWDQIIVYSNRVSTLQYLHNKKIDNVYYDLAPFAGNLDIVSLKKPSVIFKVNLHKLLFILSSGKIVADSLKDKNVDYYTTFGVAMGDQYRCLAPIDYSNKCCAIINEKAKDLPTIFGMNAIILPPRERRYLSMYLAFAHRNNQKHIHIADNYILYPGIEKKGVNYSIKLGKTRIYNVPSVNYVPRLLKTPICLNCLDFFSFHKKSVLLNPSSNTTSKRYPNLIKPTYDLFQKLADQLNEMGYEVFTNAFVDDDVLGGTKKFSATIYDTLKYSQSFDCIITSFTGFMEAMIYSPSKLIVISPNSGESRLAFAESLGKSNYYEHILKVTELDDLSNIILDQVTQHDVLPIPTKEFSPGHIVASYTFESENLALLKQFNNDLIFAVDEYLLTIEKNDSIIRRLKHSKSNSYHYLILGIKYCKNKQYSDAVRWLSKAISLGLKYAALYLFDIYWVNKDYDNLRNIVADIQELAISGNTLAMVRFAKALFYGKGTECDIIKAQFWANKSRCAGEPGSDVLLYHIECQLGSRTHTELVKILAPALIAGNKTARQLYNNL